MVCIEKAPEVAEGALSGGGAGSLASETLITAWVEPATPVTSQSWLPAEASVEATTSW